MPGPSRGRPTLVNRSSYCARITEVKPRRFATVDCKVRHRSTLFNTVGGIAHDSCETGRRRDSGRDDAAGRPANRSGRCDPEQWPDLHRRCGKALGRSGSDLRNHDPGRGHECGDPRPGREPDPGDRPEGRVRVPGLQRRARPYRQHRRVARRRQPARGPRSEGVYDGCPGSGVAPAERQLDHPRRLGRLRAVGCGECRGVKGCGAGCDGCGAVHAFAGADRSGHAGASRVRAALRPQHVPRELGRVEARRYHRGHTESAEWRDREGRKRTPDRDPQGLRRRSGPQGHSTDPIRAAARAGARRSEGSARGRRHDHAGPDERGAAARLPGAAAPGRADRPHHAAPHARQRRAYRAARAVEAASATTGSASSATRHGSTASWGAAARCSSNRTATTRRTRGCCATS